MHFFPEKLLILFSYLFEKWFLISFIRNDYLNNLLKQLSKHNIISQDSFIIIPLINDIKIFSHFYDLLVSWSLSTVTSFCSYWNNSTLTSGNTTLSVRSGLVGHSELSEIFADHIEFNFNVHELLAIVHTDDASNKFRDFRMKQNKI